MTSEKSGTVTLGLESTLLRTTVSISFGFLLQYRINKNGKHKKAVKSSETHLKHTVTELGTQLLYFLLRLSRT